MRRGGPRERAAGPRADQLGDVGGAEPAVPPGAQHVDRCVVGDAHARVLRVGARGRAPLPGHHRRHDDARRRLALHPGGTLHRARERDRVAARRPLPGRRRAARSPERGRDLPRVDGPAASRRARSRATAAATRRTSRPTRIAEFLLLNADFPRSIRFAAGRVESALKAVARQHGARHRAGRAPRRTPARRRSTSGRSTRSWPAGCTRTSRRSRGSAPRSTARSTRPTSRIRSKPASPPERSG